MFFTFYFYKNSYFIFFPVFYQFVITVWKFYICELIKVIVQVDFENFNFGDIKIHNRYGIPEKFQGSTIKIEPLTLIWSLRILSARTSRHFHKRNNKLINLCEIGLFYVVILDLRCF